MRRSTLAFKDYSLTPASNTALADGTYVGPNMLRNKVRPAIQQIMADGKALANDLVTTTASIAAIPAGAPGLNGINGGIGSSAGFAALFSAAGGMAVGTGITRIRTSGYSADGLGGADYIYDAAVNAAYVTANPRAAFLAADGRGFKLDPTQRLTPHMFGAVGMNIASTSAGYPQATLDLSTNDTVALQAFFDFAFPPGNSGLVFDWTGHWAISAPLFLGRPLSVGANGFTGEYHARRYICGHLHVLPVTAQPGGVAMTDVLTVMGPNLDLQGELYIHDSLGGGGPSYANRRFKNGVRALQTSEGSIESITVNGAKRDAVIVDTLVESWTVRAGTPYEVGSVSRNCIGLKIGRIYAAGCGSTEVGGATKMYSTPLVSKVQGSDPAQNGVFVAGSAGYNASIIQRTQVTVASTAEFQVGDFIKVRIEIPTASFTTIAADNATGKLTLASGDGLALGLGVGQKIILVDGGNVGVNDEIEFLIVAIGGTSNRELTVYPKPTTETAKAYTAINTRWTPHKVNVVASATQLVVFPWVPDATNSAVYLAQGYALNHFGQDSANVNVGYVGAFLSGGGLRSAGLYGAHVGELLTDFCEIGAVIGADYSAAHLGTQVDHRHFEATIFNVIQASGVATWSIGGGSAINLSAWGLLGPRGSTSAALSLGHLSGQHIVDSGRTFDHHRDELGIADFLANDDVAVSNDPILRNRIFKSNGGTIKLDFDRDMARLNNVADASLIWMSNVNGTPTGTATFSLSTRLANQGWTMLGTAVVTAPAKIPLFRFVFDEASRQVVIIQSLSLIHI